MWKTLIAMAVFAALIVASATPPFAGERSFTRHPAGDSPKLWRVQQSGPPPRAQPSDPREMLEGGMKMVLQALELMIRAVPQYAPPEVLENGDIIIRRIPNEPLPKKKSPDDGKSGGKERQI